MNYYKERKITLKSKDIYFSINAYSFVLSHTRNEAAEKANDMVATETDSDFGRRTLQRCLEQRIARLRETLCKFLKESEDTAARTDVMDTGTAEYDFVLSVSTETQDKVLDSVKDLMHEYAVKGTLADWYGLLGTDAGAALSARADAIGTEMKSLLYNRAMPSITRS